MVGDLGIRPELSKLLTRPSRTYHNATIVPSRNGCLLMTSDLSTMFSAWKRRSEEQLRSYVAMLHEEYSGYVAAVTCSMSAPWRSIWTILPVLEVRSSRLNASGSQSSVFS
jgi:hypothetical protein